MAIVFTQNASSITPSIVRMGNVDVHITSAQRTVDDKGYIAYEVEAKLTNKTPLADSVMVIRYRVRTIYAHTTIHNVIRLASDTVEASTRTIIRVSPGTTTRSEKRREPLPDSLVGDFFDHDVQIELPSETAYIYSDKVTISFDSATASIPRCVITYNFDKGTASSTLPHPDDSTVTVPASISRYADETINDPGPAITTDTNYKFKGWYTDASCIYPATFPITVGHLRDDPTLYAKWELKSAPTIYIKIDGIWEEGELKAKVNGEWVDADAAYVKINGEWLQS